MREHGPWVIKKSDVKYRNRWISVREDEVIRPDGSDGIFGVVEMTPGVSILPIGSDGSVHLTKEFKFGVGRYSLEVVSGGIDPQESPLAAAKRELEEEIGATARSWIDLGITDPFTSVVVSQQRLFLARDLHWTEPRPEDTEQIELVICPLAEAISMVERSDITHTPSALLILKAARWLENNQVGHVLGPRDLA